MGELETTAGEIPASGSPCLRQATPSTYLVAIKGDQFELWRDGVSLGYCQDVPDVCEEGQGGCLCYWPGGISVWVIPLNEGGTCSRAETQVLSSYSRKACLRGRSV